MSASEKVRKTRRQSCRECRQAQSTCDGGRPVCGRCSAQGVPCLMRAPRRRQVQRGQGIDRVETSKDVVEVRRKRPRLTAEKPMSPALTRPAVSGRRGRSRDSVTEGTSTSLGTSSTESSSSSVSSGTGSPAGAGLSSEVLSKITPTAQDRLRVSHTTSMHLVHLFFDKIQPWMPIFHRPRFIEYCSRSLTDGDDALQSVGLEDRLLFLGIFAMAARFSSLDSQIDVKACERGDKFATEAKMTYDVARDEVEPSLGYLQGCVLLAFYYYTSDLCAPGWVIVGVCVRLAYALRLHEIDGEDALEATDDVEVEARRRVWWLVWDLDCFGSTVLQRPFAIDQRRWTVRLPVPDRVWFAADFDSGVTMVPGELVTNGPGQVWRALVGIGSRDERAGFLVANILLSVIVDRCQQKQGVSLEEKMTLENDVSCAVLALPAAFDLEAQPPVFTPESFSRSNWIIGTRLLLSACACLAAGIKVRGHAGEASPESFGLPMTTSAGLAHMSRMVTIIRHWAPDYINLAHPFLAYALAPILGSESPTVKASPTYPSFRDLASLVQSRFAERWKIGKVAIDIGNLMAKQDELKKEEKDLTKQYPLYFSSFYTPKQHPGGSSSPGAAYSAFCNQLLTIS